MISQKIFPWPSITVYHHMNDNSSKLLLTQRREVRFKGHRKLYRLTCRTNWKWKTIVTYERFVIKR